MRSFVFCALLVVLAVAGLGHAAAPPVTGNAQLISAINRALGDLNAEGELAALFSKYYPSSLSYQPGCLDGSSGSDYPTPITGGNLDNVISRGVLRLGRQFPNPPNVYANNSAGLEWELGNKIAAKFTAKYSKTITVQWIDGGIGTLLVAMKTSDDIDAYLGGATLSLTRDWLIGSCPYATTQMGYIIKNTASAFNTITSEAELNAGTIKYAVTAGSTADLWAQANLPLAERHTVATTTELYEMLQNDTVNTVVRFEPFNSAWIDTQADTSIYKTGVFGPFSFSAVHTRKDGCVGNGVRDIRLGNQQLIDAVDRIMNNLRNTDFFSNAYSAFAATIPSHVATCGAPASNFSTATFPTPIVGGTLHNVVQTGKLRVGRTFPNAPFAFTALGSADVTGLDVTIMDEIAVQLGLVYHNTITVEWVDTTLAALFNPTNDAIDLIMAGVGPSFTRAADFTFTCSYTSLQFSYIVGPKDVTIKTSVNNVADLNRADVTIAVLSGSTVLAYAQTNLPSANIVTVSTATELYEMVSNSTAHALLRQDPNSAYWISIQANPVDYKRGNFGYILPAAIAARRDACSAPGAPIIHVQGDGPVFVDPPSAANSLVASALFIALDRKSVV